MRFQQGVRVHLVGISGAGLSSLASYLKEGGAQVTGSDLRRGDVWNTLEGMGIPLRLGHDPSHLDFRDGCVVASAAVPRENPEVREARKRGLEVLKFSEALGELSGTRPTLAVAGTHGKTSTSGMLVCALRGGGQDPGYILGGSLAGEGLLGGRVGDGRNLVVEACEYDRSFHRLRPAACAILNVEADHFDCYPDWTSLEES
ncbi:MAG TPA: UDP-N-acetylmuramate--L-alanine ligase, partial [Planctomycetes bacterium]|nr:UDP-N-acetylmuramate--L-alanine ligase [Planctomycetota bacterium]